MFEQVMAVPAHTRRAWTTMLGMAGETLLVAAALLAPLLGPASLPRTELLARLWAPSAPVAPPPPGPVRIIAAQRSRRVFQIDGSKLIAPAAIPAKPALIDDDPPLTPADLGGPGGVPGGISGGVQGGIPFGLPAAVARAVPPPTPPPPAVKPAPAAKPAAPAPPPRIRQGGRVQQGRLIHEVIPVYPLLARQARISGTVELMGVVGVDGRIRELRAVKGHPLLVPAAIEAVRQWVYRPAHLNDKPVEVIAPITVTFVLNN